MVRMRKDHDSGFPFWVIEDETTLIFRGVEFGAKTLPIST